MKPNYKILIENNPLEEQIRKKIKSISVTDESGFTADTFTMKIDDSEGNLAIPRTDVIASVSMGYGDDLTFMGKFIIDDVDIIDPPALMIVKGKSANMQTNLKALERKVFIKNNLKELFFEIASQNNLNLKIDEEIGNIPVDIQMIQANESTLHFITRICKKFGAVFKLSNDDFLIMKRSKAKSVTGKSLPKIKIYRNDVKRWNYRFVGRENYNSVSASWNDITTGGLSTINEGEGKPVFNITDVFHNKDIAIEAAKAKLKEIKQNYKKLTLSLDGNTEFKAEIPVEILGFREKIDGEWFVKKAVHTIGSNYVVDLECVYKED